MKEREGGGGGGGKGITGEGIIPLLYEEKNAFFTFLFIICVTVENIYHSGDTYTGASSSSVFMPQLWYGSTQIGFDLKFNHNVRDWSWYIPNKKGGKGGGGRWRTCLSHNNFYLILF